MSELDDIRRRVTALEETVTGEAALRAAVDHDLSRTDAKLEAMRHLLQALSITQGEHTSDLREVKAKLGDIDGKLDEILRRLNGS
jgi:chromosome segregation ATPase